jgi:DNA-binding transcriptional MerR regulator/quercetin dioxygenase-like cupin family protein
MPYLMGWSSGRIARVRKHGSTTYFRIGEVAEAARVSPQTVRDWERQGLLAPKRSAGGQRLYSHEELQSAQQISQLRRRNGWNSAAIRSSASIKVPGRKWAHLSLGMRIRVSRRNRQLTLRQVASKAGISPSFLASVERGTSGVSVQTLNRLADVLELPPSAFAPSSDRTSSLVRPQERARTVLEGGVTWEELVTPWRNLEPALLIVPPGASSGGPITRPGEIFVFVLAGALSFDLLDQTNRIVTEPGDALVLEAGSTWSWENDGPVEARVVWVEQLAPDAWTRRDIGTTLDPKPSRDGGNIPMT